MAALSIGEIEATLRLRDELTSQLKFAQKQLAQTGEHLQRIGRQAREAGSVMSIGLTVPLVAAGAAALKFSADFQTAMVKVGNITNIGIENIGAMRKEILKLGPTVGVGPKELAAGLLVVASTGLKGAEALEVLEQAAKGTAVGLGDTKDIARAVTAAVIAYKDSNLTATEATNKLFVAVREGGAEAEEFAGTLGRVVGIASQVGVSFDEVLASMATFTRLGVKADEAATALRGVMATLLKPSKGAEEALRGVGLSVEQLRANVKEKGLAAALTELVQLTKDNDDAMAAIIPNVRALSGVMGTAGAQADAMATVLANIKAGTTELDDAFKVVSKTLGFQWNAAMAKAEGILLRFGDAIAPAFGELLKLSEPVLDFVGRLADGFANLPGPVKMATVAIGLLLAALGPIVYVFGSFIQMAGFAATGLSALAGAFGISTVAAAAHSRAMVIDAGATAAQAAATKAAATALKFAAGEQLAFGFMAAKGAQMTLPLSGAIAQTGTAAAKAAPNLRIASTAMTVLRGAATVLAGSIGLVVGVTAGILTATGTWNQFGRILSALAAIIRDQIVRELEHFIAVSKAWITATKPVVDRLDEFFGISRDAEAFKRAMTMMAEGLERFQGANAPGGPKEGDLLDRARQALAAARTARGPKPINAEEVQATAFKGMSLDDLSKSAATMVQRLAEARAAVANLTAAQRAEIAAGREMGANSDEIAASVNSLWPQLKLTAAAVDLYKEALEEAADKSDKFKDAMERVRAAAIPLSETQKILVARFRALGLSAEEMAPAVNASAEAIAEEMKVIEGKAELLEWITDKQREYIKAVNAAAVAEHNVENIAALKALTQARNDAVDALLTGVDSEVRAIERRRDADIEAIRAETHEMEWNKKERIRLREEQADREISAALGMYGTLEAMANAHNVRTKIQLADEWANAKMFLDLMEQNREAFNDDVYNAQKELVKKLKKEWRGESDEVVKRLRTVVGAINELAAAWSQLAMVTEEGSGARKFAEVANATSIMASDIEALATAPDIFSRIVAGIKLVVDAAKLMWDALSVSNGEDVARRIGKGWGIVIGEELGDAIWETAKKAFKGDKFASELAHMQDIIAAGAEGTGVTKEVFVKVNFDALAGQLRNVFALLEIGTLNAGQAAKILQDNFNDLLDAGTSATGFINAKMEELINLTRREGLEVQAVTKFLKDMASMAVDGLNKIGAGVLGRLNTAFETLKSSDVDDAAKSVVDLTEKIGKLKKKGIRTDADRAQLKALTRELDEAQKKLDEARKKQAEAQGTIAGAVAGGQAAFDRFGRLAVLAFATALSSGQPLLQILNEMGPALDEAAAAQENFGFKATGAFGELIQLRQFVKDNQELVGTLDGVNNMLVGLKNSGFLTQEAFGDLSAIAVETFDEMVKKGLPARQALTLMQPTLQRLWELQKDFGFEVDESTQKLIDQGIEAGIVGEQHRSASDRMVLALEHVAEVIDLIAVAFGVTLPSAAEQGAKDAQAALDGIDPPDLRVKVRFDIPKKIPTEFPTEFSVPDIQTGQFGGVVMPSGIEHFQFGGVAGRDTVPALVAPGETIRTPQQEAQVQREIGGSRQPVVVQLYLEKGMLAEVVVDGVGQNGKTLAKLSRLIKQVKVK